MAEEEKDNEVIDLAQILAEVKNAAGSQKLSEIHEKINNVATEQAAFHAGMSIQMTNVSSRVEKLENKIDENGFCKGTEMGCASREDEKIATLKQDMFDEIDDTEENIEKNITATVGSDRFWTRLLFIIVIGMLVALFGYLYKISLLIGSGG